MIEAKGISKSFGDTLLFEDLSFSLPPAGIVGVIGPNGAGKTTLFRMLVGAEKPDTGELRLGSTVALSYVDQSRDSLDGEKPVWEQLSDGQDPVLLGKREVPARAYASWFNFKGGDQQKRVKDLSGGERNRLHLGRTLKVGGNVLLLDEPTNDLDVDTLRALEEALLEFAGCVVVISHDRWFLDRIATHILAFEGDSKVLFFEGNFQAYEEDRKRRLGADADQPHRIKYKKLQALSAGADEVAQTALPQVFPRVDPHQGRRDYQVTRGGAADERAGALVAGAALPAGAFRPGPFARFHDRRRRSPSRSRSTSGSAKGPPASTHRRARGRRPTVSRSVRALLDFGCGYGRVTRVFAQKMPPEKISVFDVDRGGLPLLRRRIRGHGAHFCQEASWDWNTVGFGKYDWIWVGSVFTHLDEGLHPRDHGPPDLAARAGRGAGLHHPRRRSPAPHQLARLVRPADLQEAGRDPPTTTPPAAASTSPRSPPRSWRCSLRVRAQPPSSATPG